MIKIDMDLREYLFRQRLSCTAFAKRINYDRRYLNSIVLGKAQPGKKLAKIIEEATNGEVTVEELLNSKETP